MKGARRTPGTHLASIADSQHGLFTRRQAFEVGLSRDQLKRRLASGQLVSVDYGVYRHAATPESWHQRLMAACLAGPAVASHRSAGLLWNLPDVPAGIVEVTALRHRRRKATDVIWHESFHLTPRDITEIEGIQVTRPVRTFLDLGVLLSEQQLEEILNEGVRRHLLSVPAIWRRMEELGSLRRGTGRIRRVLERYVPGQRAPESVLETRFLQLIRDAGLPEPVRQHEVQLLDGQAVRIDFGYPDLMLVIELDGEAYHFGERQERRDRRRENGLVALRWRVLRFDWDDVTRRRAYVVATVRGALRSVA